MICLSQQAAQKNKNNRSVKGKFVHRTPQTWATCRLRRLGQSQGLSHSRFNILKLSQKLEFSSCNYVVDFDIITI